MIIIHNIAELKSIANVKKKITRVSKKSFKTQKELDVIDAKIALLVRSKITIDEILSGHGGEGAKEERLREFNAGKSGAAGPTQGQLYGRLFYLLHRNTEYIARLASYVKFSEIDQFLQTVMFSLYGNHQCEAEEEHLLLTMFRSLMADELGKAHNINEIFRQNSVLTRMLTTYTRRGPGFRYLGVVQGPVVREVLAAGDNLSLEINPSKVFDECAAKYRAENDGEEIWERDGLTEAPPAEEHAGLPYVQAAIRERVPQIEAYAERLLKAYEAHIADVPYEMRWICRQVKDLLRARWPRASYARVCAMVGGFFVLRFLNPALISPVEYGVADAGTKVSPGTRRNLTVIAKVQQNLSNSVRFSEAKELFMTPLNTIFDRLEQRFLGFLDALTDVDDLDHHLSLDSYVRLAKLDREELIPVTANELYFMHDLLLRNSAALKDAFGPSDDLCALLAEMPPAPQKLSRVEDYEVILKLVPPPRATDTEELMRLPPEALFAEAEYHLFSIACAAPPPAAFNSEKDAALQAFLEKVAAAAAAAEGEGGKQLREHVKKLRAVLELLQKAGTLSAENNFLPLRKALASDIDDIPARVKRSEADLARLKEALTATEKCYNDLLARIDTYAQYLSNVRTRSVSSASSTRPLAKGGDAAGKKKKKKGDDKDAAGDDNDDAAAAVDVVVVSIKELCRTGVVTRVGDELKEMGATDMRFAVKPSGAIAISALTKKKETIDKFSVEIVWDDLLGNQAAGKKSVSTDMLDYNVDAMTFFINKNIYAKN